jgi:nicotinamidase-related amidase
MRALLVIDLQHDVVAGAHDVEGVVTRVHELVTRAHASATPVIVVQHNDEWLARGSDEWQLIDGLGLRGDEERVDKQHRDSFAGTNLADLLERHGIDELVICGAASDFCVNTTAHAALARGYDVTLVGDAHTTGPFETAVVSMTGEQVISFINEHYRWLTYPGRRVAVASAAEVIF